MRFLIDVDVDVCVCVRKQANDVIIDLWFWVDV